MVSVLETCCTLGGLRAWTWAGRQGMDMGMAGLWGQPGQQRGQEVEVRSTSQHLAVQPLAAAGVA